jgi:tripartite-type tricarboxylate transporter receptor subunit TctC
MTGLSVFFHATISRIGAQSGNSVVQLGAAMKGRWFVLLLAGALVGWPHIAHSQNSSPDYPDRPITLVVPYASGGGNDVLARAVAEHMSKSLGQALIIENRGGAGGSVGTRLVAKAAPDGYTLGLGGTGTLAIDPTLYPMRATIHAKTLRRSGSSQPAR